MAVFPAAAAVRAAAEAPEVGKHTAREETLEMLLPATRQLGSAGFIRAVARQFLRSMDTATSRHWVKFALIQKAK